MRLSGNQVKELVRLISESLGQDELIRVVRYALEVQIDEIVAPGTIKKHAVFLIIEYSRKKLAIRQLIEAVIDENAANSEALRTLLLEIDKAETVAPSAGVVEVVDPLAPYFPRGEPFVDRVQLAQSLTALWDNDQSGVLVVRGERYSGRSHSWWRIVDAARTARVVTERVDVSRDPGSWTVTNIVDRVARFLKIDREALKDPLAQGAAQGKALISAMTEKFRDRDPAAEGRLCLVFDGLDRLGVDSAIIELVEDMISAVLQGSLPGLSLILLGYGEHKEQAFGYLIHAEYIDYIQRRHVEEWLQEVLAASGRQADPVDITTASNAILNGLAPPYDAQQMNELRTRAKQKSRALLKGERP